MTQGKHLDIETALQDPSNQEFLELTVEQTPESILEAAKVLHPYLLSEASHVAGMPFETPIRWQTVDAGVPGPGGMPVPGGPEASRYVMLDFDSLGGAHLMIEQNFQDLDHAPVWKVVAQTAADGPEMQVHKTTISEYADGGITVQAEVCDFFGGYVESLGVESFDLVLAQQLIMLSRFSPEKQKQFLANRMRRRAEGPYFIDEPLEYLRFTDFRSIHSTLDDFTTVADKAAHALTLNKTISDGGAVIVARDSKLYNPAGLVVANSFSNGVDVVGRIDNMVVDPQHRGNNLGELLMRAATDWVKAQDAVSVEFTSRPERETANALYQRMGFVLRRTNVYSLELT